MKLIWLNLLFVAMIAPACGPTILTSNEPAKLVFPDIGKTQVQIGKPAPNFVLTDLEGREIELSNFEGKIVVLEWFNPLCPFIATVHYREFSLKNKPTMYADKNVVWLGINSQGPTQRGGGLKANIEGREVHEITFPILLDESGEVGRLYEAKRTPEMFIIDEKGILVYRGSVDNTMGGDLDDADPPPPINYIDHAIGSLLAEKPIKIEETETWG